MNENYQVERIIIDPERLIEIKKQRKSFKMVSSTYQPPPEKQPQPSNQQQPRQHTQNIRLDIDDKDIQTSGNYTFIQSILSKKAMNNYCNFDEGDCIPCNNQDRWLLVKGQILVTGINHQTFIMRSGYFFFLSKETKKKIKQVVSLTSTKLLLIPGKTVDEYLRNYLFLKNAQKVKYLKECPFLIWNELMWEDLAMCMQMITYEKQQIIYSQNQEAEDIYFVKDGIVLLQRTKLIHNGVLQDYQSHYQKDQVQGDALIVVRKGMIFGMDGIFFNQKNPLSINTPTPQIITPQQNNPLNVINKAHNDRQIKSRNKIGIRLYTAKTIGRCEVYKLKKSVLNVFFNIKDMFRKRQKGRQLSSRQLDRISREYIQLVAGNPKISKSLKNIQYKFKEIPNEQQLLTSKKNKINQIKDFEKKVRKISIQSIMKQKNNDSNKYIQQMNPFTYPKTKYQLNKEISQQLLALNPQRSSTRLPLLKNRHLQRTLSRKQKQQVKDKEINEYKIFKKAVQNEILTHSKGKSRKELNKQQSDNLFIQISSYKSIVSQLT